MSRIGLFARVLEGGVLHAGLQVEIVQRVARSTIQAAVITVSDRCANGVLLDTAGPAVAGLLESELHARIAWAGVVPDEAGRIAAKLKELCDCLVDLVITAGGTGISPRDVTPEATLSLIDREVPGLAEAMRAASAQRTPNALLSRAITGIRHKTLIVNLPGSREAATENLQAVLAALPHAVRMLRGETGHPEQDEGRSASIDSANGPNDLIRPPSLRG
jgi:molybdenum cofactor synthesis domain-containing protein